MRAEQDNARRIHEAAEARDKAAADARANSPAGLAGKARAQREEAEAEAVRRHEKETAAQKADYSKPAVAQANREAPAREQSPRREGTLSQPTFIMPSHRQPLSEKNRKALERLKEKQKEQRPN
jgi:hypothetical protein